MITYVIYVKILLDTEFERLVSFESEDKLSHWLEYSENFIRKYGGGELKVVKETTTITSNVLLERSLK